MKKAAKRERLQPSVGFVWAAAGLTAAYVAIHLPMLLRSLGHLDRLLGALVGR